MQVYLFKSSSPRYKLWLHTFLRRYRLYKNKAAPMIMTRPLTRRSVRAVTKNQEGLVTTQAAMAMLEKFFQAMEPNDKWMEDEFVVDPIFAYLHDPSYWESVDKVRDRHYENSERMYKHLGFRVGTRPSLIRNAGDGVFVTAGSVPSHTVVAMYPGLVYKLGEPTMIPSIRNEYMFRCFDGVVVDGKSKGLSKFLYESCYLHENFSPQVIGDVTWLTPYPINPMAVGQYVKCAPKRFPPNVVFQEFDFPCLFPHYLRKYIPNCQYRKKVTPYMYMTGPLRSVLLVTTRRIEAGEELFSEFLPTFAKPKPPE